MALLFAGALAAGLVAMALMVDRAPAPTRTAKPSSLLVDRAALDRCRAITMPDSTCEAAWAAERRRFFREPKP